jgi:hypothetical protein
MKDNGCIQERFVSSEQQMILNYIFTTLIKTSRLKLQYQKHSVDGIQFATVHIRVVDFSLCSILR